MIKILDAKNTLHENFRAEHWDVLEHRKITDLKKGDLVYVVNGMYDQGIGEVIKTYPDYIDGKEVYGYDVKIVKSLNDGIPVGTQYSGYKYDNSIEVVTDKSVIYGSRK